MRKKRRIDEQIGDAKFVIRLLEPYETHEGGLGKMLSGAPSLTFGELAAKIDEQKFAKTYVFSEGHRKGPHGDEG